MSDMSARSDSEHMREFDEREERLREIKAERCWLRQFAPPELRECDGRLDPCHLIPKQLLRRELGDGTVGFEDLIVPGCRKHHRLLDEARRIKIPRKRLPARVEWFAEQAGLAWFLDFEYGERYGV